MSFYMDDYGDGIKRELEMSDRDFKRNYRMKNMQWWRTFKGHHDKIYGGVYCAGCGEKIPSSYKIRNFGALNYDTPCFRQKVMGHLAYMMSLEFGPTPDQVVEAEWLIKAARVMDGGLVKLAETDEDLMEEELESEVA